MIELVTDPATAWILAILTWLVGTFIACLLLYLVIRLAITHGMLSYQRQLEEERGGRVHRDRA